MSKKEFVQNIAGLVFSVLFLIGLWNFIDAHDYIPRLVFWICFEILLFVNGNSLYNMITLGVRVRTRVQT